RPDEPVRRAPRSAVVSGAAAVRPGAMGAGGGGEAPQVLVLPVRRGLEDLHRGVLRMDGGHPGPGHAGPAVAAPSRPGPSGGARPQDHASPETRHAHDRRPSPVNTGTRAPGPKQRFPGEFILAQRNDSPSFFRDLKAQYGD